MFYIWYSYFCVDDTKLGDMCYNVLPSIESLLDECTRALCKLHYFWGGLFNDVLAQNDQNDRLLRQWKYIVC